MGLLDQFDNPDFLSAILGAGGNLNFGGNNPSNIVNPTMTPAIANPPMPTPAPGMPTTNTAVPDIVTGGSTVANPPLPRPNLAAMPPPGPGGGIGSDYAQSAIAGGSAAAPGAIPPPVPGAPGAPMSIVPPGAEAGAPNAVQGGNLGRALGIMPPGYAYPYPQKPSLMQNFMGALGQGLSGVGGNTAGGAFARGMGGALKGGINTNNQQEQQQLERQKNFFNETIANENQYIRNMTFPYNVGHLIASTNYLTGRANGTAGGGGTNAWQYTDIGRMHMADQEADREYNSAITALQKNSQAGLITPDDAQARFKQLETQKDQMRQNWYKRYRVDPDHIMGTQGNPIDGTKLTDYQLQTMPPGTYYTYKDKDGKVVTGIRSQAMPGQEQMPNWSQQRPLPVTSDTAATQSALQPSSDQAIQ